MRKALITILIGVLIFLATLIRVDKPIAEDAPIKGGGPTYFAQIDKDGVVLQVIVADQAFIDSGKVGDPKNWIETTIDNSKRKNYAGKGYKYDNELDAFIPPKPTANAILNTNTGKWTIPAEVTPDSL